MGRKRNLLINPHDIIGRAGGLARAKSMTPQRRKEIAMKAAAARWKGHGSSVAHKKAKSKSS